MHPAYRGQLRENRSAWAAPAGLQFHTYCLICLKSELNCHFLYDSFQFYEEDTFTHTHTHSCSYEFVVLCLTYGNQVIAVINSFINITTPRWQFVSGQSRAFSIQSEVLVLLLECFVCVFMALVVKVPALGQRQFISWVLAFSSSVIAGGNGWNQTMTTQPKTGMDKSLPCSSGC